jgi:hypothetical protein
MRGFVALIEPRLDGTAVAQENGNWIGMRQFLGAAAVSLSPGDTGVC